MKTSKNKLVVILMGPPGAGKGTQAELLADKLSLYYFETSKLLEQSFSSVGKNQFIKIKDKKYSFVREKNFWENGKLCSIPFVNYLVGSKIEELHKKGENLVVAGSPRSLEEAEFFIPLLEKLYKSQNIKIILIDVPAGETIFRNSHRRICSLMRHPILFSKETKNLKHCPLDGSELVRRKGLDDPETIKVRLREYRKRTFPLIEYFEKQRGLKVKKVNGVGPVAKIFERIGGVLK